MRSFALTLLAGAALGSAAPAFAQDSAATSGTATFTGPRVEGVLGWDRVQNAGHDDGLLYGLGVGYDMQIGGAVVGAEAELSDSNVRQCAGIATVADPELCARTGRDIYVGGRVGAVVGDSTLIYGKIGYTNARAKLTADDGTGRETIGSTNLDGIRVGAGVEQAIGPNTYLKGEYRYSNYEQGFERHQALAGFGFRF